MSAGPRLPDNCRTEKYLIRRVSVYLKQTNKKKAAEELGKWLSLKYLPHKPEDLSSDPGTHIAKLGIVYSVIAGKGRGGSQGPTGRPVSTHS